MPQIGSVKLGECPRVVLAVDGDSSSVARASRAGVDILEARVDLFPGRFTARRVVDAVTVLQRHKRPLIGTIRGQHEGGKATLSDEERVRLYQHLSPLVDAVDVDLRAALVKPVLAFARRHHNTIILSHHDFHGTPSDAVLRRLVNQAVSLGADIVKIAAFAQHERDVLRLLQFTMAHRPQHLVTIAMGPRGSISRLVFPLAGSLLTYTSVSPSHGQIDAKRLIEDLRFYYPRYREALLRRIGF